MVSPAYVLTDGAVVVPPEMVFLSVTSSRLSPPVRISRAPERSTVTVAEAMLQVGSAPFFAFAVTI